MSKIASTCKRPCESTPSTANSRPGMNVSTSTTAVSGSRSARMSGWASSRLTRAQARWSAVGVSARMTPRLPESATGLTTTGPRSLHAARSCSDAITPKSGTGRPASRNRCRVRSLLRLACAAACECHGRRRASATAAASVAGRSPTARTPSSGLASAKAAMASTASAGSWKRTAIARSRHGSVELIAPVGRQLQLDPEGRGRLVEGADLIAGGGGEQENAQYSSLWN